MNSDTPRTDAASIERAAINGPPNSGTDGGSEGFEFVVTVAFVQQLERENQQLRDDLKQCAECLNTAVSIIKGEYGSNNWRLVDFKIALSLPSVQVALKETKQ